jgi:shikimate dehydrogenase
MTIAIPYKNPLVHLVDEATERAKRSGSVNLIRFDENGRSYGDTVDGLGFVVGLEAKGVICQGKACIWWVQEEQVVLWRWRFAMLEFRLCI